jgi:hypothetical protein
LFPSQHSSELAIENTRVAHPTILRVPTQAGLLGWDSLFEGINYFADTLLFAGAILALGSATPGTD